jgi:hypothetical protein
MSTGLKTAASETKACLLGRWLERGSFRTGHAAIISKTLNRPHIDTSANFPPGGMSGHFGGRDEHSGTSRRKASVFGPEDQLNPEEVTRLRNTVLGQLGVGPPQWNFSHNVQVGNLFLHGRQAMRQSPSHSLSSPAAPRSRAPTAA